MRALLAVWIFLMPASAFAQDCVILLHGLGRTSASFLLMEEALKGFGFRVVNHSYKSTKASPDKLVGHVDRSMTECAGADRVHFVTHSMGGILLRLWLASHRPGNLGRVVMLGPPNHGSEVADKLGDLNLLKALTGLAGETLRTGAAGITGKLGVADFDLGVIAGNLSPNPVLASLFKGPNDGKVSVESTKLDGMRDHIVLPTAHTFMMNNPLVIAQVLDFLRLGRFDHDLTLGELLRRVVIRD